MPSTIHVPHARPAAPLRLEGTVLDGKYEIIRLIGRGGMGAVYLGQHVHLERRVAVKVLAKGHEPGSEAVKRFYREARIAGKIGHPSIVDVYDLGTLANGAPYLVMEYLEGETLAERIARVGAQPIDETLDVICEVLSALGAAHAREIVHRDMKPANVFLVKQVGEVVPDTVPGERRSLVRLLDFGISKDLSDDGQTMSITKAGKVVGTPYYMSPEQARGQRDIDHRVDVYGTGVTLYEALTGRLPYKASSYGSLVAKILDGRAEAPSHWRPALSPAIDALVLRAMHKDRAERFQSADEMLGAALAARGPRRPKQSLASGSLDTTLVDGPRTLESLPYIDEAAAEAKEDPTDVSDRFGGRKASRRD